LWHKANILIIPANVRGKADMRPSPPLEVFLQILASLFVRDLEHSFGRGYIVAIVYSPNERYVLVHVIAPILRVYA
ncbi:MAG: hypothetical protein WBE29_14300, partial [Pseudolabrys sp.]